MEDRKKVIRELENRKAETLEALDGLLENFGESLLTRLESGEISANISKPKAAGDNPQGLYEEKAKDLKEIADAQAAIKEIEANLSRLGDLEEQINRKEQENQEKVREISHLYATLGQLIFGDSFFAEFTAPFEPEVNDISLRIDFQKKKLEELENSEGGFFTKVANGAKSMVTKSLLAKYSSSLEKLYRNVGEQFILSREKPSEAPNEIPGEGEASTIIKQCEELRGVSASIKEEITKLRNERKECADALDQGGNPMRRISDHEKYIARVQENIRKIHRRFGSCVRQKEWVKVFTAHFIESEEALNEKIDALEDLVKETDKRIEKTKLAIEIDNEKAEIEKLKEAVEDKQRQIANANAAIVDFNEKIAESGKHLEELQEKYGHYS